MYADFIHTAEHLTDEELGKLIKHLFRYVNDLNPEAPDRATVLLFEPIKRQLKRDLESWGLAKVGKSMGGKLGMERRWGKKTITDDNIVIKSITEDNNVTKSVTGITVNVNDNVNVNVNEEEGTASNSVKVFKKPTLDEVKEYFILKGYSISTAEKAFNYYSESDWVDSHGNKIKNWKQKMISVWFKPENKEVDPAEKYRRIVR